MKRNSTGWSRAAEWYAAGLFLLYAVLLFAHPSAPSLTDYANWSYQGVLLRDHLLGRVDAAHWLKPYPVPNSAATMGVALLALLLPWKIAAKLWLGVQFGVSFAAVRHLLQTLRDAAPAWMIVPQAVLLNINFWYGFANFELGVCWALLAGSLLLRLGRGSGREWTLGLVLVPAFFTHMIPFAFACLLLLLWVLQTRRYKVLWQLVPGVLLTVWYLGGRFFLAGNADGQAGMVATVTNYSLAFWAYKVNSYVKSFGFVSPEGQDYFVLGQSLFLVLLAVNAAVCVALGCAMIAAARRGVRRGVEERFLWVAILLVLPVYLLAPAAALGVSDPGSRLLQVALALGIVLACREAGRMIAVAAGSSLILTLAGLFLFVRFGFQPRYAGGGHVGLPAKVVEFNHVPNADQDYFYAALARGDMNLQVFPTGMFLNRNAEPPPGGSGSDTH